MLTLSEQPDPVAIAQIEDRGALGKLVVDMMA